MDRERTARNDDERMKRIRDTAEISVESFAFTGR